MELNRRPDTTVTFDFAFKQFPESFVWTDSDHDQLLTCEAEHRLLDRIEEQDTCGCHEP